MVKEELLNLIFDKNARIIDKLHGGMMNESLVVSCNSKKYVLYIPTAQANEMVDRVFEKENVDIISSLGVTSKNIYFNTQTGVKANEFIEGHSLNYVNEIDHKKIASLLTKLHQSKTLASKNYNPFERINGFIEERETLTKITSPFYDELYNFVLSYKDFLLDDTLVLCHNDFQRSNIIKDLNDNYFIIDFEFAANNYALYDVACFGNDNVNDGVLLLKEYKNGSPSLLDYKRFYLWRIFISLQWYNVALIKHHRGEGDAHKINFLKVSEHFISNAKEAFSLFHKS